MELNPNKNETGKSLLHDVWDKHSRFITTNETHIDSFKINNLIANILCAGPFYFYIVDFYNREIEYMSPNIESVLGMCPIQTKFDDIINRMHPDDMEYVSNAEAKVLTYIYEHLGRDKVMDYKVSYCFRFKTADGSYQLFQHQALALTTDANGRFSKSLNIHTNINHLTDVNNYVASVMTIDGNEPVIFNIDVFGSDFHTPSKSMFSKREREIINLLAEGMSTEDIARILYLSAKTIATHRKNILRKTNCRNTTELVVKCIKEGLL